MPLTDVVEKSVLTEPTDVGGHGGIGVVAERYKLMELEKIYQKVDNSLAVVTVIAKKDNKLLIQVLSYVIDF